MRIFLLAAFLLFPPLASAQSIDAFVITGFGTLWDDEGSLGSAAPIGAGIGLRSPYGWGIEALVEHQRPSRRFPPPNDVRFDSTLTAGRVRLLKYFGTGRTQAYAGGGIGATRIESTYDYPICTQRPANRFECPARDIHRRTSTSGTLSGFGGLRIAAGRRAFIRPEFELSRAGEHLRMGGILAAGLAW